MENKYVIPMGSLVNNSFLNINVKRAEGNYLISESGKKYIDLRSGLWNVSLGYNKDLYKEVSETFSSLLSLGIPYLDIHSYNHPIYNDYAKKLLDFMNDQMETNFTRVFYTNSGSEGTELSVKIIDHLATNKKKDILAFKEGYHGTFFAGMSVSGLDQEVTSDYRLPSGVTFLDCPINPDKLREIELLIEEKGDNIIAFFMEPIIGSSGTITMPQKYIEKIISICKQKNIIVVFDEVATGFYRTGRKFYYTYLEETPDIVIMSKGINNGILPFGAVVINNEIEQKLEKKHIEHFSTQNGNILSLASALKVLEYYQKHEKSIVENIYTINKLIIETLNYTDINYRIIGLMLSISINDSFKTVQIVQHLLKMGIIVYHYDDLKGNSGLTIFPPFFIDLKKFKQALTIIIERLWFIA